MTLPKYPVEWVGDWSKHPVGPVVAPTPRPKPKPVRMPRISGARLAERNALICERVRAGEMPSKIARELGVTRQRIYQICKDYGEH